MNWKKLTAYVLFESFLISFVWAWAGVEPEGDVWMSFYKKLVIIVVGPAISLFLMAFFNKRKESEIKLTC